MQALHRAEVQGAGETAIAQQHDAVPAGGAAGIVSDHQHRLAEVVAGSDEQLEDLGAGVEVEVAGGFVGKDDSRFAVQGSGDGHPLLLTAGKL